MPPFRRAQGADLPILEAFERECFVAEPWSRATLSQLLVEPRYCVWLDERAFLVASQVAGEAEIERVGVAATFRGQGVGTEILRFALTQLENRGVTRVFLEVATHNAPARALYARLGFIEKGVRRAYYDDGSDAILMGLALK